MFARPHSCQANFRIGPQRCERKIVNFTNRFFFGIQSCRYRSINIYLFDISACESGSYGCNCSEPCPYGTYGQGCYVVCYCSDEQFCDPVVGCTNNNTTTDITTGK